MHMWHTDQSTTDLRAARAHLERLEHVLDMLSKKLA